MSAARAARERLDGEHGPGPKSWLLEATAASVDRVAMLGVIKRRSQRARHFRSAPIAVAFFGLYLAAIVQRRGAVSDTFHFEKAVLANVIGLEGVEMPTTLSAYIDSLASQSCVEAPCPPGGSSSSGSSAPARNATCQKCACDAGVLCALFAGPGGAADADADDFRTALLNQARVAGGGIVIGGAVLSQTRRARAADACARDFSNLTTPCASGG